MSTKSEIEALKAELEAARAELQAIADKKAAAKANRKPRAGKALDADAAAAKVAFETIEYAAEDTLLRDVQDKGRPAHVYAFHKLVKRLSYGRMASLIADLIVELAEDETAQNVIFNEAFTRVPKAKPEVAVEETTESTED